MKKIFTLILIFLTLISKADYWTQKADFGGTPRFGSFSFVIGNKAYVGSGEDSSFTYKIDFWEYDPSINIWTQKADFGGSSRIYSVGFSEINKGYAGLGTMIVGTTQTIYHDWWEYDPSTNSWLQKGNYPGDNLVYPVSFTIGNDGYVGTGRGVISTTTNSFWVYNASLDSWTQKSSMLVSRMAAIAFSIGNNGYVGTGSLGGPLLQDFWEYSSTTNIWTQKANTPSPRTDAFGFSVCDKGYFGLGESDSIFNPFPNDLWQYDPLLNQWIQKTSIPVSSFGLGRDEGVSFSIGNKGYIGLGGINGFNGTCFKDFWEYTPDSACATGIEETTNTNLQFTISPNPAKDELFVNGYSLTGKEKTEITIIDVNGKKVYHAFPTPYSPLPAKINVSNFSKGIYFVEVNDGNQKAVKKFIKN